MSPSVGVCVCVCMALLQRVLTLVLVCMAGGKLFVILNAHTFTYLIGEELQQERAQKNYAQTLGVQLTLHQTDTETQKQ